MTFVKDIGGRKSCGHYQGPDDDRLRKLLLSHIPDGVLVKTNGCTFADALARLQWSLDDVRWIDLGPSTFDQAVYLSPDGWHAYIPKIQSIFSHPEV
jgi:hypothetical protein